MAFTFKRGIHPPDHKAATTNVPVRSVSPHETVNILMQQHIGAPAKPIVKKGDRVLLGQMIGEQNGFISAPVHSTVSGTVKGISEMLHPNGFMTTGITIENDGLYEEHESLQPRDNVDDLSSEEIIAIIRDAGVVGLGGAAFPTYVKLSPPKDKPIDTVIVNGAECEPYLTSDDRALQEEAEKLLLGLKLILRLFPGATGKIGVETNKQKAIENLEALAKAFDNIEVCHLKPKYPQGAEKQLVYALTKKEVPSTGLPLDIGCIVINVDTVIAIHRAVYRGRPLMRRLVTVSGGAIKFPQNIKVRLGMTYREVIDAAGGFRVEPSKIINGGPMMGVAMYNLDVPLVKVSSSILCFTEAEAKHFTESPCIRCSKCVSVCPMKLMPNDLNRFALREEEDLFRKYKGMACIECGACSYSCPSHRYLLQSIRTTRRSLMAQGIKS